MLIKTRYFGEIDVDDQKVITFDEGLIGFENLKKFTLIYNNETEESSVITWLQSLDEPRMALPVISPFYVKKDYNPVVEDEVLAGLGELQPENTVIFLTLTVPSDITRMTTNLKAPIIINAETKKGCQVIAENADYVVKYNIYEVIQKMKEKKGE
ncbi:MAG: flagellar assembly protein FliW [Lachnospiraceae bacterium]|nr:flagellar assembly protein FliW [Lachnospiraceae bacterium]MBP3610144.1 flagellar assembly protein FliW [Lachnospiraceae bacterium]